MPVNSSAWKKYPIAARETKFSADDAIARALQWSEGSASKFNSSFLYRIDNDQPQNPNSYRLPIVDIIDGRQVLIPRAVFSAAVILSGGHGGLEDVLSEPDREELKKVITEIYEVLQQEYQDPRTVPPWLLGKTEQERDEEKEAMGVTSSLEDPVGQGVWSPEGLAASVNKTWNTVAFADTEHAWDREAVAKRIWDWSGGDFRQYRKAFLWHDPARPEQKNSYKLPIADVIDGELRIVPRAVTASAAVLASTGADIPDDDIPMVADVVKSLQVRQEAGIQAAGGPVYPPSSAFDYPHGEVRGAEPFTVTADGQRARGHLWLWNKCHAGIMDACVMAPRSATNYQYFHNGQVLTADGKMVKVGKITMGTGHAGPNMRWIPAADHYDNTGTVGAVVRITEDAWGGYASGVPVSTLTDEKVQELRRSPISGDWRRIGSNLELVAALAVNVPGFPIVASINGEPQSLVAAGILTDEVLASMTEDEKLTEVEKDLIAKVDELDEKITELATRGRTRKWGKLMAALDERNK